MTNEHHARTRSARRRGVRIGGALAMALAMVGTTLLLATPAAAFEPLTPIAATAVYQSGVALANPDCESLIGAGSRALLTELRNADRIVEAADQDPPGENGGRAAAGINGIGLGGFSKINLYAAFYEGVFIPSDYSPVPSPLSGNQVRVVILLHEIAHATGAHGRHTPTDPGVTFNGDIVRRCVRPASSPPPEALRIDSFSCQPLPLGGTRDVNCQATWVGGIDPASVQWVAPQAPRQPLVSTILPAHVTSAVFKCDPIPPRDTEYTYLATVMITDSIGTRVSTSTIPCGW